MEILRGDELKLTDGAKFWRCVQADRSPALDVRKGKSTAETHPKRSLHHSCATDVLEDASFGLARLLPPSNATPFIGCCVRILDARTVPFARDT